DPFRAWLCAEEAKEERERKLLAALERDRLEQAVGSVKGGELAAIADGDAVALELADQVVGHRLLQVASAMEQGDQRAAASEPDSRLSGRVAAADHGDARGSAQLCFRWSGGVEDARALVFGETLEREPPVVGTGGEDDRAGRDLVLLFQPYEVSPAARLEPDRTVGGRRPGAELACLADGPGRQLRAADPSRETEVVLDPARRPGLPTE